MKKIYGGTKMITYKEFGEELLEMVKEIYMQEGWWAYLGDDEKLARAFKNSLYTLGAFEGDRLTGFVRCVGDGEHILLVQDLIVDKKHRRQRLGTALFKMAWERYADVRMFQVVTDLHDEADNAFYQSFGMKKLVEGDMVSYFR